MAETFDSWAVLELMGHVRMAGRVTEEERFGSKMGRIDVPGPDDSFTTVYFGGASVYRMTPTTEEIARSVAGHNQPRPVSLYELPKPAVAKEDEMAYDRIHSGEWDDPQDDEDDL
jgi:hypothetical protein